MRLWHYELLPYLPKNQIIGQYRECVAIAKSIFEKGYPNHILVNKIMDYPIEEFISYGARVYNEIINRGYKCNWKRFIKYFKEDDIENYLVNNMPIEIFKIYI